MAGTASSGNPGEDPREFASGKVLAVLGVPAEGGETLEFWIEAYLTAAVRGVRSPEVAGKIARHLGRFRDWSLVGFGHDRIAAVTAREVTLWREHLTGTAVRTLADGRVQAMAPATVNNHLAHLSALFTWTLVHAPSGLLVHGDPTKGVDLLPLPAPQPRALTDAQVRTVKNVLDRLEGFHRLKGRRHQGNDARPARHAHARPVRDRAIVAVLFGAGLRRAEVVNLDLTQLQPRTPGELQRVHKARLIGVRGKGRTQRTVFLGSDARLGLADYLAHERPDDDSPALFLAAASIATRRPGGRLSPRTINTIVGEVGRIHDLEVQGPNVNSARCARTMPATPSPTGSPPPPDLAGRIADAGGRRVGQDGGMTGSARYPEIGPYAQGMLDVGDGQLIHWAVCGNPDGKPAVVVHGGPGSGCPEGWARYFHPGAYRIVLCDQRGCGRSTPHASVPVIDLTTNTTQHLIADLERLRTHLGIDRWLLFGGSWGTTLALAYAQTHPNRVSEMVLFSVVTTTRREVDHVTRGMYRYFPAEWERFADGVPGSERDDDLAAAYSRLLHHPDPQVRDRAARNWCDWEDTHVALRTGHQHDPRYDDPAFRLCFARLVTHYWSHAAFLDDDQLLRDVGRLAGIPAVLVHGRADISSPVAVPWQLAHRWAGSQLLIVENGGHGANAGLDDTLIAATKRFAAG